MYLATNAPWSTGTVALFLFGAFGVLVLVFGIRAMLPAQRKPGQPPAWAFQTFGLALLVFLGLAAVERWDQTTVCMTALSAGKARAFAGVLESVQVTGKSTAPVFELVISGERFASAGPGSRSECGFKQSLAQTAYPEQGRSVSGRAVGNVIVEMRYHQ